MKIPLPYLLLYKMPLFGIMRTPARFTVLVMLALAVLVAYAVAQLLQARTRVALPNSALAGGADGKPWYRTVFAGPRSALALVVLPLLIIFEFAAVYPMVPPGWNVPIYQKIAAEPGNFALLELPIRPFGDYMAYQTIHDKPIIGGTSLACHHIRS